MARKTARSLWAEKLTLNPDGQTVLKKTDWGNAEGITQVRASYRGIILGIDPSLRGTGLAVVSFGGNEQLRLLASRTVKVPAKASMPQCLAAIFNNIVELCTEYSIRHVACEQTIYVQNFQTAQILGAARGAALTASAMQHLEVHEYPPLRVKQAVVGYGRASKEQVIKQVRGLLNLDRMLPSDEADAAAVAICHGYTFRE